MSKTMATIDLIESSVNRVSKAGKPYSATVLHYTVNGEKKEKMILDRPMRDRITNSFHSGDTVVMVWEKNDKGYNDLVDILPSDGSEPVSAVKTEHTSPVRATTNDREVGMQVGNALTNAATLLASGIMNGSLESVAEEVIRTGERLKAKLLSGEL